MRHPWQKITCTRSQVQTPNALAKRGQNSGKKGSIGLFTHCIRPIASARRPSEPAGFGRRAFLLGWPFAANGTYPPHSPL